MVHAKTFVPRPKPVIEVVGESEFVMVPDPEINVHAPVPTTAVFAFMVVVGDEIQSVWFKPALAMVGISLTMIAIVDEEAAQGGFDIVHAKIFVPKANPVTDVVGEREFVIVPAPETNVHAPVPTIAVFAAMIVFGLLIQIVWLAPALAVVGLLFTTIATVADEAIHGALEMVH